MVLVLGSPCAAAATADAKAAALLVAVKCDAVVACDTVVACGKCDASAPGGLPKGEARTWCDIVRVRAAWKVGRAAGGSGAYIVCAAAVCATEVCAAAEVCTAAELCTAAAVCAAVVRGAGGPMGERTDGRADACTDACTDVCGEAAAPASGAGVAGGEPVPLNGDGAGRLASSSARSRLVRCALSGRSPNGIPAADPAADPADPAVPAENQLQKRTNFSRDQL